ncbi:MAG: ABC transporter permease [Clostridiaceae bacterium BRH_c20a]|nr:MAG: ABC transporter permease [Clostridiaceae bacterium BRH_c20a]
MAKLLKIKFNKENREPSVHDSPKTAAILLAPALLLMTFIIFYPLIRAFILAFYNLNLTQPNNTAFVFLENFRIMFRDETFWVVFKNTFIFTFTTVSISLLLGLIIAIVFDQLPKKYAGYRGIILVPWVIPGIVVGYLFMYMFDVEVGIINFFLQKIHIIENYLPWLMRDKLAMASIIIAHIWNQTPFFILMITAGLKAIPRDVQEAAYVEGASRWQEFRHVTLPFLKGILVISSLLMVIRNINNFPIIFTMTGGGPANATTTAAVYIYKIAFEQYQLGYASAVGVIWVFALLALSIAYIKSLQKDF